MSWIKSGTCSVCNEIFYWSMGHPPSWEVIPLSPYDDNSPDSLKQWIALGQTCSTCAGDWQRPGDQEIEVTA
jgi:hypothetical protein